MDTQADISIIKEASVTNQIHLNRNNTIQIKGITKNYISSLGTISALIRINSISLPVLFHVVPDAFDIPSDGILGKDFIKAYKCKLDYDNMTVLIQAFNSSFFLPILNDVKNNVVLPARSEVLRFFYIDLPTRDSYVILNQEIENGIFVPRTVIDSNNPLIPVMNTTSEVKVIPKTYKFKFEPISNFNILHFKNSNLYESSRIEKLLTLIKENSHLGYQSDVLSLCKKYSDIFFMEGDFMTTNNFYTQELRISDNNPVYIKNYRLPYSQKEEIEKQTNKLLHHGLIEPSYSNYNSPIILVPKKGNSLQWRMCIDFRAVNKKLIADKYPLPRIEDILDNLGRSKFFSILDLYSGFHQIPLHENSRDITSFSTNSGSYRWKVLPFGLNVSPNSFSRMMNLAFAGATPSQCFIYMDDIIVIGCSAKHHLKNLESVFKICKKYNLKLNPSKCQFFKSEVTYIGHRCTDKGILPDMSKFEIITKYPRPFDKNSVKRFVAFMNFYRKFVPNFAELARPLNLLTRRKVDFKWTNECEHSFQTLKNSLLKPPILQYPDFKNKFIITTDASKHAVGACLSQNFDGVELPVSYASRSFTKGELNKSTIEKELIAIHFAITHYRPYIFGTHFIVKSDHKPLTYLFSMKNPSSKLTRIRLDLEEYQFTVEYIQGKSNVIADALSRINIRDLIKINEKSIFKVETRSATNNMKENLKQYGNNNTIKNGTENKFRVSEERFNRKIPQIKCAREKNKLSLKIYLHKKILGEISINVLSNNTILAIKPKLTELEKLAINKNLNKLQINNDDLLFRYISLNEFKESCNKYLNSLFLIIVPKPRNIVNLNERKELIKKYHDDPIFGGHVGKKRLLAKLKMYFYWPKMYIDVSKYINECRNCKINKPKFKTVEPLVLTESPEKPFDIVVVDTIGPFNKTDSQNKYAVTLICNLTKYLVIVPVESKEACIVAKAIFENVILMFGPMKAILTDNGTEYKNNLLKELLELMKIEHHVSTPYHHETVGSIERCHRVLNEYLRSYINEQQSNWDELTKYFSYCYNVTPHMSFNLQYTPFELVFGKTPNIPEFCFNTKIEPIYDFDSFAKEFKFKLQTMHKNAKYLLDESKKKAKIIFDKKVKEIVLKIGDKVLIKREDRKKLDPLYIGPYIVKDINKSNVIIEYKNKEKSIHKNNVIKY